MAVIVIGLLLLGSAALIEGLIELIERKINR